MQFNKFQTEIIPLVGGVDMVTPQLMVKPGKCINASNFEPDINGGYRRIKGIERFDGRSRPSEASYTIVEGLIVGPLAVGDIVYGSDSGKSAIVAHIIDNYNFVLANMQSGWIADEAILVNGEIYAYIDSIPPSNNAANNNDHAIYKAKAADAVRALIQKVPGSGPIRGVKRWKGITFAFRDSEDGTECLMYIQSQVGWWKIDFRQQIQFDGAMGEIKDGDIITGTTSLSTATVLRATLRTGTWTTGGTGSLVFIFATGNFIDNEIIKVGAVNKVVANGADEIIKLLPGGKFEFDVINFSGNVDNERLYFADGVNNLHEFDLSLFTIIPIKTGIGTDNPKFVVGHKKQLISSIGSEIIVSGIGNPYSYTALTGAAQIATGETITGLKPQIGDTQVGSMVVGTTKNIYMLYGNDVSDYILSVHSPGVFCTPYTLQNIGFAHFWDINGLTQLMASQQFGSFQSSILTQAVQPIVDNKTFYPVASCVSRSNNLYKIFFNNGSGLNIQILPNSNSNQPIIGDVMPFDYGKRIMNVVDSSIDSNGKERKFGGCMDGYIYELDVGTSLDGDNINAFLILAFNSSKSPDNRKNYHRCKLLFNAGSTANLDVSYDLSFGNFDALYANKQPISVYGNGGYWDTVNWDSIFWDSAFSQELTIDSPGNGTSISYVISNDSSIDESFVIEACKLQFTTGRLVR